MRTLPRSPARATPGPASARASSISPTQITRSNPDASAWQIVDVARSTSITIPSGARLRVDAEVCEDLAAGARRAEGVDPDRVVDPARPAEGRRGLERDLRQPWGQHLLLIRGGLRREELPAGHRHDAQPDTALD